MSRLYRSMVKSSLSKASPSLSLSIKTLLSVPSLSFSSLTEEYPALFPHARTHTQKTEPASQITYITLSTSLSLSLLSLAMAMVIRGAAEKQRKNRKQNRTQQKTQIFPPKSYLIISPFIRSP